ncbi:hypothetical protein [Blastococcus litoris]|uniref:hypothetical protein n=1 Tax=Blastococcus litoris TaxID=2171622 RepID=UPI0013DEB9D7|nr:hypothetical protein [Blastococcus litoris]
MLRWLCALTVGAVLSGFAFLLLTGRYINDGPVLVVLTVDHGLHAGDLFVLAGWVMAIVALGVLVRNGRRVGPPEP